MSLSQSTAKFLKLSFLFLFIGYYSGITLFYHTHIVNGRAVVHSHFYKRDSGHNMPVKRYSHPISAYDAIHELNKISCEELAGVMPYQQPLFITQSISRYFVTPDITIAVRFHIPPRAPPVS